MRLNWSRARITVLQRHPGAGTSRQSPAAASAPTQRISISESRKQVELQPSDSHRIFNTFEAVDQANGFSSVHCYLNYARQSLALRLLRHFRWGGSGSSVQAEFLLAIASFLSFLAWTKPVHILYARSGIGATGPYPLALHSIPAPGNGFRI